MDIGPVKGVCFTTSVGIEHGRTGVSQLRLYPDALKGSTAFCRESQDIGVRTDALVAPMRLILPRSPGRALAPTPLYFR